jgi:hypothetical protein
VFETSASTNSAIRALLNVLPSNTNFIHPSGGLSFVRSAIRAI